jgi:periplasmic protein TonB
MFDTALLESGPHHRVRGNAAGLPLAVAAHLLVIGAFLAAAAWKVGDPAEPEIRIVFPGLTRLSAPPPPGGGNPAPAPPQVRSNVLTPPTSLPDRPDAPQRDELPPGPGGPGTDMETSGPGTGPGIEGGTGEVPGVGPEGPGESEPIQYPNGDVTLPVLLTRVEPGYPEWARRARIEGTLILEAVITARGDVDHVRILKSIHPLLDEAASEAVRQWRYQPATRNGRAVPVYLTVTVRFGLRS